MDRTGTAHSGPDVEFPGLVTLGERDEPRTARVPLLRRRRIATRLREVGRPPLAALLTARDTSPGVLALDELPRYGCRW